MSEKNNLSKERSIGTLWLTEERNIMEANLNYLISKLPSPKGIRKLFNGHYFSLLSKMFDLCMVHKKFGLEVASLWLLYSDIEHVRKGQIKKTINKIKNIEPIGKQAKPWKEIKTDCMVFTQTKLDSYDEENPNHNPILKEDNWDKAGERMKSITGINKRKKKNRIGFITSNIYSKDVGPVEPTFIGTVESFDEGTIDIDFDVSEVEQYVRPKSASERKKNKTKSGDDQLSFEQIMRFNEHKPKDNIKISYIDKHGKKITVVRTK